MSPSHKWIEIVRPAAEFASAAGITGWLLRSAQRAKARVEPDRIVFGAAPGLVIAMRLVAAVAFGAAGYFYASGASRGQPWWVGAILIGFGLVAIFAVPATITLSFDAIRSRYWWGHAREIRWNDVTEVRLVSGKRQLITVVSADGTKITHSEYNVDRSRFLAEVRARTRGYAREVSQPAGPLAKRKSAAP
jgi:hypothetical protein